MPYDVKRFIFSVSLCAMLAVNPVLATVPGDEESVDTAHNVYVESNLNKADNGIAGVGYVNRMVDAAGNAAQAAEGHAAAAGKHALNAAKSAAEAHAVLADKVNIAQGTGNENKAMVTDDEGSVYAGYVAPSMIKGDDGYTGFLGSNGNSANWRLVSSGDIADDAVTSGKIAAGAVTSAKIANGAVYSGHIAAGAVYGVHITDGAVTSVTIATGAVTAEKIDADIAFDKSMSGFLSYDPFNDDMHWEQVGSAGIANGAVTVDKIDAGIVFDESMSGFLSYDPANDDMYWRQVGSAGIANGAVTNDKIAGGAVTRDKIAHGAVIADKISAGYVDATGNYIGGTPGQALLAATGGLRGTVEWGQIGSAGIADGAVTTAKIGNSAVTTANIAGAAVTNSEIADGAVTADKIAADYTNLVGDVLLTKSGSSGLYTDWGQVITNSIANGAVTIEKTAGVVGMVPVGGEGAPTYGSFWIE